VRRPHWSIDTGNHDAVSFETFADQSILRRTAGDASTGTGESQFPDPVQRGIRVEQWVLFAAAGGGFEFAGFAWYVGGHCVAQTLRPHVCPVLFDVLDAGVAAFFAENDRPTVGDIGEDRPEGVLLLMVDQNREPAVVVIEGVGAQFHLAEYSHCADK